MRTKTLWTIALSWILALAGLAQPQEPIRIGVPLALTGPLAVNGEDNRRGALLYFEGGGFQLAGRKVEVKVEDTEGKADVALTKVRKLVESDRVHAIVGIIGSHEAYAIREYIHAHEVPTVITTAGANDLTLARKSPFIFRVGNDNTQENLPLGHYAYTKLVTRGRSCSRRTSPQGGRWPSPSPRASREPEGRWSNSFSPRSGPPTSHPSSAG